MKKMVITPSPLELAAAPSAESLSSVLQQEMCVLSTLSPTPPPLNTDYTLLNNHLYSAGQPRSAGWDPLPSAITPWEWAVAT